MVASRRSRIWIVLGLALAVRLAGMVVFQSYDHPHEYEMGRLARNILDGNGFSVNNLGPNRPTAAYSPFEGYFLALFHYLFGYTHFAFIAIITVRSILSVAVAYVIYLVVRATFSERIAFYTLIAVAFHPAMIYYSSLTDKILRPPYSVLCVSMVVGTLVWYSHKPTVVRSVLTGVAFGLCSLVQSNIVAFVPFALAWMGYVAYRHAAPSARLRALAAAGAMPLALFVSVSPWALRNYYVTGKYIPFRSGFGLLFWVGNNPVAYGDAADTKDLDRTSFDLEAAATLPPEVRSRVETSSEVERDRILLSEALVFIRANFHRYCKLSLNRLRYFWIGLHKKRTSIAMKAADWAFSFYSITLLALTLGSLAFRRDRYVTLFLLFIASLTLLYVLVQAGYFYYRMDLEPFCLTLAIVTILGIVDRRRGAPAPTPA